MAGPHTRPCSHRSPDRENQTLRLSIHRRTVLATTLVLLPATLVAQGTAADYERARRLLPERIDSLVYHSEARPRWVGESDIFWYRSHAREGDAFVLVDPASGVQRPAFDHERLAAALSRAADTIYQATNLPFESIELTDSLRSVKFVVHDRAWRCTLTTYECERDEAASARGRGEVPSPDGKWIAFLRDHDIWIRSVSSGERIQLSFDGRELFDYRAGLVNPVEMERAGTMDLPPRPAAVWSPDSKRLISWRLDRRSAGTLTLVQSVPKQGYRPVEYTYQYALPGDVGLTQALPVIFDVSTRRVIQVATEPLDQLYYGGPRFEWASDGQTAWFTYTERGFRSMELRGIDPATGASRTMVRESVEPHVDPWIHDQVVIGNGREVVWTSDRDGWNHLYLYDGQSGKLVRQLTRGAWAVREIVGVDEKARVAYFTAGGREAGEDPYLRHLYRVGLDGKDLRLLTPENADHSVWLSPSRRYVVDTYSRVDLPPVSVLRNASDGSVIRELERADVEALLAAGWTKPEPFTVKARDGKTDIHGVIWRPSNFDPKSRYPVIEQIYTGPHGFHVPKSFQARSNRTWPGEDLIRPIAELGFVVVMVDGFGTNGRSREFRDFSYKNLGDGGIPDHIAALKQLAERYPYLDISRVGIFGHSAGGYDSMHAMLTHPEFYKVCVSTSGNHDHRMDKASWVETWMSFPVGKHYAEQSNIDMAGRLEGKVLLVHGDLDENVHPSSTLRLADALMKADKDFDLLIVPNGTHNIDNIPYVVRRRWDYFVQNLLGVAPPHTNRVAPSAEGASAP